MLKQKPITLFINAITVVNLVILSLIILARCIILGNSNVKGSKKIWIPKKLILFYRDVMHLQRSNFKSRKGVQSISLNHSLEEI